MSVVQWKKNKSLAIIEINNPPVNALSQAVRYGIVQAIDEILCSSDIKGILLTCGGRTFCAGADIKEFSAPPQSPSFNEVISHIEKLEIPVIAVLHGSVFGGGLELALGCHYRTALKGTILGFPEVQLGLIPGAGGTQRLPRLCDIEKAIDMITTGKPIPCQEALACGIIDQVFETNLLENSRQFATDIIANNAPIARSSERSLNIDSHESLFADRAIKIEQKARGALAPLKALEAIHKGLRDGFAQGLVYESELFTKLKSSPQSKAMRHIFFAERQTAKLPELKNHKASLDFKTVGIVGAGTMGCGIAMAMSNAGLDVTLVDQAEAQLEKAKEFINKTYQKQVHKGHLTDDLAAKRTQTIKYENDLSALASKDLIIEAVFESMDVKQTVFSQLDQIAKEGAVLATNTSYLDVNKIASFTSRPERVLGMHFFSPAHIMKLLEIVRAENTAPDVLSSVLKLTKKIGKIGVVSGVCYGFIGNRMLQGYMREAGLMLLEGALPQQIDTALVNFGMPMGVFAMLDMAGLDIGSANRKNMSTDQFEPLAFAVIDKLVSEGRYGQKTGAGVYIYEAGKRGGIVDPYVTNLIEQASKEVGFTRREISDKEIVDRCIYALINEAAYILDENIAAQPSDIDVVYVNGYGFPRYRGGPLFYADQIGLPVVLQTISSFKNQLDSKWWVPAPLFKQLVEAGGSFNG